MSFRVGSRMLYGCCALSNMLLDHLSQHPRCTQSNVAFASCRQEDWTHAASCNLNSTDEGCALRRCADVRVRMNERRARIAVLRVPWFHGHRLVDFLPPSLLQSSGGGPAELGCQYLSVEIEGVVGVSGWVCEICRQLLPFREGKVQQETEKPQTK